MRHYLKDTGPYDVLKLNNFEKEYHTVLRELTDPKFAAQLKRAQMPKKEVTQATLNKDKPKINENFPKDQIIGHKNCFIPINEEILQDMDLAECEFPNINGDIGIKKYVF